MGSKMLRPNTIKLIEFLSHGEPIKKSEIKRHLGIKPSHPIDSVLASIPNELMPVEDGKLIWLMRADRVDMVLSDDFVID